MGRPNMKKLILTLGIAFVALQVADAFLTLWAVNHGFEEVNPLLAPIAGTWLGPVVKIVPAALVVWGLDRLGRRYPRTRPVSAVGLGAAIVFLGVVLVSNVAEL